MIHWRSEDPSSVWDAISFIKNDVCVALSNLVIESSFRPANASFRIDVSKRSRLRKQLPDYLIEEVYKEIQLFSDFVAEICFYLQEEKTKLIDRRDSIEKLEHDNFIEREAWAKAVLKKNFHLEDSKRLQLFEIIEDENLKLEILQAKQKKKLQKEICNKLQTNLPKKFVSTIVFKNEIQKELFNYEILSLCNEVVSLLFD